MNSVFRYCHGTPLTPEVPKRYRRGDTCGKYHRMVPNQLHMEPGDAVDLAPPNMPNYRFHMRVVQNSHTANIGRPCGHNPAG